MQWKYHHHPNQTNQPTSKYSPIYDTTVDRKQTDNERLNARLEGVFHNENGKLREGKERRTNIPNSNTLYCTVASSSRTY